MNTVLLSHYEVAPLRQAYARGRRTATVSADLGRTSLTVTLDPEGVHFADGVLLTWEQADRILAHPNAVFAWTPEGWQRVRAFSPLTGRSVALYPTGPGRAPTLLIAGIPMHRVRGTDPWRDTQAKVRALRPRGRVLDTCFGLGYSAWAAARTADSVLSVELDPAVLAVARRNPWSVAALNHPKVNVVQADVARLLAGMPRHAFSAILHDPPQFALAGELYGADFYEHLWRVLKPGGRLFHYVGNPGTKMGRNVTRGVMERLRGVGFARVKPVPRAGGVLAVKPRGAHPHRTGGAARRDGRARRTRRR